MRTDKIRKYLIPNIPYLFILWAFLKLGTAYRLAAGNDFAHKLIGLGQTIGPAFADFAPGLAPLDWLVGIVGAVGFRLLIYFKSKNAKKFRRDAEYGSARWGTEKDIKPFVDPKFENNVILTGTEFLTMNTRPKIPANARNLNCCIIGSSGSGKTTLLNCISTIDSVSSGHIYLGEQDLTTISSAKMAAFRRENLGFIFQDFNLLEPLTIEENISLPLSIKGIPGKEIEKIVKRLMQRLNISDIAGKLPAHVSGGQKQRCACARAFVNNPKLILADEPTGALDSASAKQLLSMLAELNEQDRSTILMVTHDPFSASFGNRVLFIKDGNLKKEIDKGQHNRNDFYQTILSEISAFGGE